MTEAGPAERGRAFGIDAFSLDDRLRLFPFAAAEKRTAYLWLLRALDHARANYVVLLHAGDARRSSRSWPPTSRSARAAGARRRARRAGRLAGAGPQL